MADRVLSATSFGFDSTRFSLRTLVLGSLTGAIAGMGSFMYIKADLMPWGVGSEWALVLIGLAGVYTHLLAADLSESITRSLVAVVVGFGVHVGAWIAPLWVLSYSPLARDILLPKMMGEALAGGILVYLLTFYGSYFGTILLAGYLEP